jgi:Zn-dependent alcohol dehydrogenase
VSDQGEVLAEALALTAKRGRVVVTNIHPAMEMSANVSLLDLTLMEKQVVGSLFGSGNPRADIPKLLGLYREGQLDLDGLVTRRTRSTASTTATTTCAGRTSAASSSTTE